MSVTGATIQRGIAGMRATWPGLLTVATVAMAAVFLSSHYGGPTLLYALLLGIALNFLAHEAAAAPGIEFAARGLLRLGVALLGARIGLEQIAALGWETATMVVFAVLATLALGRALARPMGLTGSQGILTGGAVGICGASAALAIATALPRDAESERNTLFTVVGVTTLGTVTMVAYPMIVSALGLEGAAAGVFLGGTIHDVAQVVGAGYMVSETAGDSATVTKLVRVAMLVPVVLLVAVFAGRSGEASATGSKYLRWLPLPPFLLAFILIAATNSAGALPSTVTDDATAVSRACLVCAIAAIGMKTELRELARVGWPAVALMLSESALMAALMLGFVMWRLG